MCRAGEDARSVKPDNLAIAMKSAVSGDMQLPMPACAKRTSAIGDPLPLGRRKPTCVEREIPFDESYFRRRVADDSGVARWAST